MKEEERIKKEQIEDREGENRPGKLDQGRMLGDMVPETTRDWLPELLPYPAITNFPNVAQTTN